MVNKRLAVLYLLTASSTAFCNVEILELENNNNSNNKFGNIDPFLLLQKQRGILERLKNLNENFERRQVNRNVDLVVKKSALSDAVANAVVETISKSKSSIDSLRSIYGDIINMISATAIEEMAEQMKLGAQKIEINEENLALLAFKVFSETLLQQSLDVVLSDSELLSFIDEKFKLFILEVNKRFAIYNVQISDEGGFKNFINRWKLVLENNAASLQFVADVNNADENIGFFDNVMVPNFKVPISEVALLVPNKSETITIEMYANVAGKVDQHSAYRYSKITGDRNTRREIREVTTPYAFEWNFINADDNKKTNQQDVTIAPSTGLISSDTVTIAYSLPSKYSGKPLKLKNRLFVRPTNERVVSRERLFEIDREAKTRLHMLKSLHEANRTAKNGNVSKTEKSGIIKKNTIADLKSADSVLNRDAEIEILRRKRAKIAESEFVNEGEGIVGQTFTDIESQHEQGKMISDNSSFQESAQTFSNEPINFLQLHKSESFIEPLELRMNLTTIPSSHTAHRGQFSGDNLSSTPQRKAVQSSNANIIKTSISGFNEENVSNSNALSVFSWY